MHTLPRAIMVYLSTTGGEVESKVDVEKEPPRRSTPMTITEAIEARKEGAIERGEHVRVETMPGSEVYVWLRGSERVHAERLRRGGEKRRKRRKETAKND